MKKGLHVIRALWKDPRKRIPNIDKILVDTMLYGTPIEQSQESKELSGYLKQVMRRPPIDPEIQAIKDYFDYYEETRI